MNLVSAKEISKIIKWDKYGFIGTFMGWIMLKVLRISKLNKIYHKHEGKKDLEFLNAILNDFKIHFEVPPEDLKRIPKEGAFISISNHPLGGIDGILLMKLLIENRPDYKIIGNFLLQRIEPLKNYVMPVNPFEDQKDKKSSYTGLKKALKHIENGCPLGIFPAGEVSTYREGKIFVDKPWESGAVRFIKKAKVPVVPIYFHAKNSLFFYLLAKISPKLRTAKLPSELLTHKSRVIKVRIGNPIKVKDQDNYKTCEAFTEFLRRKTYMLANPYLKEPIRLQAPSLKIQKAPRTIAKAAALDDMLKEIISLRDNNCRLLKSKNYEVFFVSREKIPTILKEIGRLREITFRAIGEGTNKALDLDKYDKYYHHLFLWDTCANRLVGSYRMGLGVEIYKKYGIEGFYLNELFRIESEIYPMMSKTIEMGRAFIIKEYQQKPMPLFLLWKGIIHVTLRNPNHKYLMGGVSISNKFSNFSKSLMIEFMKSNYYDPYIAQYVHPKKEYKVKLNDADKDFIFDATKADMNKFDKIIDELEPGSLRMPVLLKKYVKQNAKVIAFNVDPKFNNSVDGLMYIRIADLPESTVNPVMEEFQLELEKKISEKERNNK